MEQAQKIEGQAMKRLPITFEERQFFKAVEKTAVVLLIMFRIYPSPINTDTLAYEMKWDLRTADKYLQSLAADNLTLLMKGQGYVLTSETRRLIAQFFGTILTTPFEAPALAPDSQAQALEIQVLESGKESEVGELGNSQSPTHTVCALEEVEESLILKGSDSTSSTSQSAQNVQWPSVATILGATPVLFGDPGVLSRGLKLETIKPWMALAWIAHAWDQWPHGGGHGELRSPSGLVYKNLADPDQPKPRAKYYEGGWNILPDEFMELIGMREYACECGRVFQKKTEFQKHQSMMLICEECSARFHDQKRLDEHTVSKHPVSEDLDLEPDETATRRIDGHISATQAWESVLGQLKMEMPKATFETWVEDTQAIHYADSVLTVGVKNTYARDWLESRLTSTVERLLVGVLNAQVAVNFVVADIEEQE